MKRDRLREPHPQRLPPSHPRRAEILGAHQEALEAGQPTYPDPITGYQVFTAAYLLARGTCCDTGCRHCPYLTERKSASGARSQGAERPQQLDTDTDTDPEARSTP